MSDTEDNAQASEEPRSLRPGQKGFAERLMSKYGWSKGKGLGAEESGIINPLRVQIEKRKKKSDAEGGGFRDSGGRGKIIGGKKKLDKEKEEAVGKFGPMSDVIVLKGMVDGMDLDREVEGDSEGGIMQEIGEECGEKYGRVERVYIHREEEEPRVFVKFTAELSALRVSHSCCCGKLYEANELTGCECSRGQDIQWQYYLGFILRCRKVREGNLWVVYQLVLCRIWKLIFQANLNNKSSETG